MNNNASKTIQDNESGPDSPEFLYSEVPSIYLMVGASNDLQWFDTESCQIEVAALDRFLGRTPGSTRRSDGTVYAFWRWPVADSSRIERLICRHFTNSFGRPISRRNRFLVDDVDTAYREISGILDMDGFRPD